MLVGLLIVAFVVVFVAFVLIWAPLREGARTSAERAREGMSKSLDEMFIFIPLEYLATVKVGAMVLGAAIGYILAYKVAAPGPYVVAGLGGVAGYCSPTILVWWLRRRRRQKFAEQLVDGLVLLSNGLRAGLTMKQAVEMLVAQSRPPISEEFGLVLQEHKLGRDMDQALTNCAKRTRDPDLELATIAVSVTRQLGGNIAEIFDRIVATIKARKILAGKAEALTAQGRMQAIVLAALPYVFAFMAAKVNPALIGQMWTTAPGLVCFAAVVILDALGYLWVRKIIDIKY
jgi:tight adherence protein B